MGILPLITSNNVLEPMMVYRHIDKICRQKGCLARKIPDERYGEVNTYPVEVLEEVIKLYKQKNRVS